jgi:hypothetical protein
MLSAVVTLQRNGKCSSNALMQILISAATLHINESAAVTL